MFKRIRKTNHKCRQAFTLVELIVVLIILAVIAAMLVPALTGYIKRAKKGKALTGADTARVACQAIMTELYGLGPGAMTNDASGGTGGGSGGDVRWDTGNENNTAENIAWGDKVLKLMDCDRDNAPYMLIFGVGNEGYFKDKDLNACYTVYYVAYVPTNDSPAVFYVNGEWIYTYPKDNNKIMKAQGDYKNIIVKDGKYIPLRLYVVSQRATKKFNQDNFWTTNDPASLRNHAEPHFKG
ncbi:MAG: prepilin-type N-terminal cleavage/methylation domain-containing protein [Clostridiales bacterium]|nr:prepilin-type N-terminal cleavage/methylation domain-containing protein [Clostridiales bacterium]